MSRNSIYVANETTTTVQPGDIIPLGRVIHRHSNCIQLNGDAVTVFQCGYYDIDVAVTFTSMQAGDATIKLFSNNKEVAGASATESILSPEKETRSVCIPATIRIPFNCNPATLTVVVDGIPVTVKNIAIRVVKQ